MDLWVDSGLVSLSCVFRAEKKGFIGVKIIVVERRLVG